MKAQEKIRKDMGTHLLVHSAGDGSQGLLFESESAEESGAICTLLLDLLDKRELARKARVPREFREALQTCMKNAAANGLSSEDIKAQLRDLGN